MKEEKEGLLPGGIRAPYPFDAAETLDCGQAFRWVELPGEKPEPLEAVDRSGEETA